ncbi:MAG: class I SAM-dependent methyltransferase [Candidatus Omnitrophica bacterium]|nr:class I SAM-dependent methyltransferase [Candidatus Omnitrophota bacterium]
MQYNTRYITCKVCGCNTTKFLGIRGNLEYNDAPLLSSEDEHIVTNIVRCRNCGFVYTNPYIVIPEDVTLGFYNEPEKYRASVCEEDPLRIFTRNLNIIERVTGKRGRILDIGSGKGEFLALAKKRGWEAFGVEPAQNFAHYAADKYNLDIQNVTLEEANFPYDYFDVVTLNMVLEHIENPHELLVRIKKVLKNGGLLFIEVPNMDSLLLQAINIYYRLKGKNWSAHLSPLHYPYHCYGYNTSSLKLLCELNGFNAIRFFIFSIGLRGFRIQNKTNWFQNTTLNLLAQIFTLINKGDILIALGVK